LRTKSVGVDRDPHGPRRWDEGWLRFGGRVAVEGGRREDRGLGRLLLRGRRVGAVVAVRRGTETEPRPARRALGALAQRLYTEFLQYQVVWIQIWTLALPGFDGFPCIRGSACKVSTNTLALE